MIITEFANLLTNLGLNQQWSEMTSRLLLLLLSLLVAWLLHVIARGPVLKGMEKLVRVTKNMKWGDILLEKKVFHRVADIVPVMAMYLMIPEILEGTPFFSLLSAILTLIIVVSVTLIVSSFLNAAVEIYQLFPFSNNISIIPFAQVLKIFLYFVASILVLSLLLDKSPVYFLSGLGAMTAVLLLIFKDTLLGFVAGVQLIANRMVAPGDWVEMQKYGADGEVVGITLNTVKIQNWDKTITTIPTYALINESFKNWRSMPISGGRRIKRSIHLDLHSIKFCTEDMLQRFTQIDLIADYVRGQKEAIEKHNRDLRIHSANLVNGRRMTNIGVFRAYVKAYLKAHPMISSDMTFLVRQLTPAEQGLPIEIYVFSKETEWGKYENLQADLFDHILSVVPQFDLYLFQNPSGNDFRGFLE